MHGFRVWITPVDSERRQDSNASPYTLPDLLRNRRLAQNTMNISDGCLLQRTDNPIALHQEMAL